MSKLQCLGLCLLFLGIFSSVQSDWVPNNWRTHIDQESDVPDGTPDATKRKGLFLQCIDAESCAENEVCVKNIKKSGMAWCECTVGHRRNLAGICSKYRDPVDGPGSYVETYAKVIERPAKRSSRASVTGAVFTKKEDNKYVIGTDYPPIANAGNDVTIYFPEDVTLDGSASTDDRGIVSWEWTKIGSNEEYARTPYLQLSHLQVGVHTFVLKVTDAAGQSSSSGVHVFVKHLNYKPPKADAGDDITIALPKIEAVLNGSRSRGDVKIESYHWEQTAGPNKVSFTAVDKPITKVTNLRKGQYVFKLIVKDTYGARDAATVQLEVTKRQNSPPAANAGGDQIVTAPVNVLIINGSQSTDDVGIRQWQWTRDPSSLAFGNIVEGTDESPILMVTDIVPGKYIFKLEVLDDRALSSHDNCSVVVKPDIHALDLVELTLNNCTQLTDSQKHNLVMRLQMLLGRENTLVVRSLRLDSYSGRAVLVFYVKKENEKSIIPGLEVVSKLKEMLRKDEGILGYLSVNVDTAVCQINCPSERGISIYFRNG